MCPRHVPARLAPLGAAALAALLAGCSGASPPGLPHSAAASGQGSQGPAPAAAVSAGPATSWPQYHRDGARTGLAAGLPAAGRLSVAWSRTLDGAVYGQPLSIGTTVIAATEGDSVYALSRSSGRVLWRARLGTPVPRGAQPCGNIGPLGITGTPVYDPATGLVYAVAETTGSRHVLVGLRIGDGRVALRRQIPAPDGQPAYDQQRGALALGGGRVYVPFGGHYGDCGPYVGSVVAVPASGSGAIFSYRVPTAREGGIWSAGGPVIGPSGALYVSVGNGASRRPPYDGSDSVLALTPGLHRTGFFAPATWGADNASDLDLGSMSPALLAGGRILAVGKRGVGYLLSAQRLGGIGGQLAQAAICPAYGGASVAGTTAYLPCDGGGMAAVATAGGRIRVLWRGPGAARGSPVVGGGAVWVADWSSGTLYELSQATGRVRQLIQVGAALPHFASPSLSGGLILLGTTGGVVAVGGA